MSPVEKSVSLSFSSKYPEDDESNRMAYTQANPPNQKILQKIGV